MCFFSSLLSPRNMKKNVKLIYVRHVFVCHFIKKIKAAAKFR